MVATLQREKQAHSKLLMRPDGDKLAFQGGIPVLTGEMGMELYDLYLDEIGRFSFMRKLEDQSFDAEDMNHVAEFLIRYDIQPTVENCFSLVMGARLHLLFVAGS